MAGEAAQNEEDLSRFPALPAVDVSSLAGLDDALKIKTWKRFSRWTPLFSLNSSFAPAATGPVITRG